MNQITPIINAYAALWVALMSEKETTKRGSYGTGDGRQTAAKECYRFNHLLGGLFLRCGGKACEIGCDEFCIDGISVGFPERSEKWFSNVSLKQVTQGHLPEPGKLTICCSPFLGRYRRGQHPAEVP
jgi:hypothetical protein